MKKLMMVVAILAVLGAGVAQAGIVGPLGTDNWRWVRWNGGGDTGNEQVYIENTPDRPFLHFDVSANYGETVIGPGLLTLVVSEAYTGPTVGVDVHQLNTQNADVDLDAAGTQSRGPGQWIDNSSNAIGGGLVSGSLAGPTGVTTHLMASGVVPINPSVGTIVPIVIPQTDIQAWLDQTAPSIVVLASTGPSRWYVRFDGPATLNTIEFETGVGGGDPVIPEPAGLGLIGLSLLALKKRRR